MSRITNVCFTGGWAHDFAAHTPVLVDVLADAGVATEVVDDLDALADRMESGADLVTIYACRFRMLAERYTPEQRATWSMEIPERTRAAIAGHVADGGALLAVHTALVCFDDWPEWIDLCGGGWSWEGSWHPEPGPIDVRIAADHPVTSGIGDFTIVDERYTDLTVAPGSTVLAVSPDDTGDQPVMWCTDHSGGRVLVDSLGHDTRSLTDESHVRLLHRAITWLCP